MAAAGVALPLSTAYAGCALTQDAEAPLRARRKPAVPDPDEALVQRVRAALEQRLDLLEDTTRRHRDLREQVAAYSELLRTHMRVLTDHLPASQRGTAGPTPSPTSGSSPSSGLRVPRDAKSALAQVELSERELAQELSREALAARSGLLARLLASMSVAVSQELA